MNLENSIQVKKDEIIYNISDKIKKMEQQLYNSVTYEILNFYRGIIRNNLEEKKYPTNIFEASFEIKNEVLTFDYKSVFNRQVTSLVIAEDVTSLTEATNHLRYNLEKIMIIVQNIALKQIEIINDNFNNIKPFVIDLANEVLQNELKEYNQFLFKVKDIEYFVPNLSFLIYDKTGIDIRLKYEIDTINHSKDFTSTLRLDSDFNILNANKEKIKKALIEDLLSSMTFYDFYDYQDLMVINSYSRLTYKIKTNLTYSKLITISYSNHYGYELIIGKPIISTSKVDFFKELWQKCNLVTALLTYKIITYHSVKLVDTETNWKKNELCVNAEQEEIEAFNKCIKDYALEIENHIQTLLMSGSIDLLKEEVQKYNKYLKVGITNYKANGDLETLLYRNKILNIINKKKHRYSQRLFFCNGKNIPTHNKYLNLKRNM